MQGPTGETRSEPVQVRCIQCGLAFTLSAKEDQFCSGRCKRESLGVRKKSSILMVFAIAERMTYTLFAQTGLLVVLTLVPSPPAAPNSPVASRMRLAARAARSTTTLRWRYRSPRYHKWSAPLT
jgi:predicted nucleic acid-binding Zn ribbon protein